MKIKNKSLSKCIVSISGKKCAVLGFVFNVHVLISSSFVCFRIYFLYPFSVEHLESESHTNNLVARLCSFTRIYVSVSFALIALNVLVHFNHFRAIYAQLDLPKIESTGISMLLPHSTRKIPPSSK